MGEVYITRRGGGTGVELKIVGGITQPTGKENLVWVNTDNNITSWEISPNHPSAPTEGMVWILDDKQNGINILKKNVLEVFPSACQQYVDGIWKPIEAYIYKDGNWVQFAWMILDLYRNGNEYVAITGGWFVAGPTRSSSYYANYPAPAVKNSDNLYIYYQGTTSPYGRDNTFATVNKINFDGFKTLHITAAVVKDAILYIGDSTTYPNDKTNALRATFSASSTQKDYTFDVSGITGLHYVQFGISVGDGSNRTIRVTEVWLE